jgi:hypothetical protein
MPRIQDWNLWSGNTLGLEQGTPTGYANANLLFWSQRWCFVTFLVMVRIALSFLPYLYAHGLTFCASIYSVEL